MHFEYFFDDFEKIKIEFHFKIETVGGCRELSDMDWGMLKMKFDNKFLINQWVEDTLSGMKIKTFEKLVGEGVLRGKTPTQTYPTNTNYNSNSITNTYTKKKH